MHMLVNSSKQLNSIFERVVRDNNGVLVRVRFIVVEIDGQFRPQIISAEPIVSASEPTVACLPCSKEKNNVIFEYKVAAPIQSNYFEELFFFNSQPTRAPSL
jgi:hypothetical protein